MATPRPRPQPRLLDAVPRLKANTDFQAYKQFLEAELAYFKEQLVNETDVAGFSQLQGRARQLQDQLKLFSTEG